MSDAKKEARNPNPMKRKKERINHPTAHHKPWCMRVNPPCMLDDVCDCGAEKANTLYFNKFVRGHLKQSVKGKDGR